MMEQKTSQNNSKDSADNTDNTYIDSALRGFRRATEDQFKAGVITKEKYDSLIAILDQPD